MLKINDWNVTSATYLSPKPGETPGASDFVTLNITDLSATPYSNIYSDANKLKPSSVGNSFEIYATFDDKNTNSFFDMYIDDGTNREGIRISKGVLTLLDGTNTTVIANADKQLHRYTLTLQNGSFAVFFDTSKVLTYQTVKPSLKTQFLVGLQDAQPGALELKFRYIKYTQGVYTYIKPKDIDFELLIDVVNTFDSPNLKKYTRSSFLNIPLTPKSWDPVSLVCGNFTGTAYDFNGLVQAATVHLPPKQDRQDYTFYYKVRFNSSGFTSDFSRTYLTERVKPIALPVIANTVSLVAENTGNLITTDSYLLNANQTATEIAAKPVICEILNEKDHGYHAYIPPQDNAGVVLPNTPVSDGWSVRIYNASDFTLKVYDYLQFEQPAIAPWNVVSYTYSATNNNWSTQVRYGEQSFVLPADITNMVLDAVFNHHIPAYDVVYTKIFNSGTAADVLRGQSLAVSDMYAQMRVQSANISNFTAERDTLNQRWRNVFNLDKSLFKNSAEMRDAMQTLVLNLPGEMLKSSLEYVITALTGAKPEITEYKNKKFNVLWSAAQTKQLPKSETYYLYDEMHPSFEVNPFILYGGADQAFTCEISIFDPYNLRYNQELVNQVIEMYKPVYSLIIANYYSYEGVSYFKKYYYGIDNYLESAYNK